MIDRFTWTTSGLLFNTTGSPRPWIENNLASSSNPVYAFGNDKDTGPGGRAGADRGCLIAGAVCSLEYNTTGVDILDGLRFQLPESAAAPTITQSACYYDTDTDEVCCYDGAQWQCFSQVYGELYATSGTLTISTEDTYAQWTTTTAGPTGGGMTVSTATDDIVVPVAGDYIVAVTMSFSGGSNDTYTCNVHEDGLPGRIALVRKLGTGGDVGSAATSGFLTLAASAVLELFCKTGVGDGTDDLVVSYASLAVTRL